jgi:lipid II:glycine glycyltransferase (peptidoglycan interpeptide bridge formation enzyme)
MMLSRRTPLGEVWYCPKGPGVWTAEQLAEVSRQLQAADIGPFVIKLEPELWESDITPQQLRGAGLIKSPFDVHLSRATIRLKLESAEDALLGAMRQKTRYNIRYAAKQGVTVKAVGPTPANLELMYALMQATQRRAGFYLRSREYFLGYWQAQLSAKQAQLFFALHDGDVVAAAFVTFIGSNSWYKDGASAGIKRNLQAPYLLQWEIIKWLKSRGIKHYDLVGVPPRDQREGNHPFQGLYQFKSGFGGDDIQFIGTYDLPLVGWKYRLWRGFGERATLAYASRVHNELWY